MQKLLITGGAGFIGSCFVRRWIEKQNVELVNFDLLTYAGHLESLEEARQSPRHTFVQGDICDSMAVERVLLEQKPNLILHLAAETHVDRSIEQPTPFVATNVAGTATLLETTLRYWQQLGSAEKEEFRLLHVSTDEVYGSLGDEGFFTEETPLAPNSPYSASKAAADMLVRAYFETHKFPAIITRCSNNYGPYQFPEKLIPLFISNALNDQQLPVYGKGDNVRDWIHVKDHARGVDMALRKGTPGEVYNFGGHSELQNIELTKKLLDALDKPYTLIKYVEDRAGHDFRYAIDTAKAERELGWAPQVDFETGLRDTIDWYLSNTVWVERVKSGVYRDYYEKQYGDRLGAEA